MTPKRHFEINWPLAVWPIVFTLVSETIYSGINHTPPSMTINTKCLPFLWLCHTWVTDPELVTVIIIADDEKQGRRNRGTRGEGGQRPFQMLADMFILSGGQIIPTTLRLPPRPPPDFQTFLRPCRSCKCHRKWDAVHCWTESRAAPTNSNKVQGHQKWGAGGQSPPSIC